MSVILSGMSASRIEAPAQEVGIFRLRCRSLFANGNFAQEDSWFCAVMKDHEYFAYIVCSRSGTLYIGMTNSIYRRALEHKRGEVEGFASKYHCDRLVYYESFDDVHKAIGREKQLKGWTRAKKIALIESRNPRWQDLAETWGAQMAFAGESIKKASS
jgi:putative endonuclease